MAEDKNANTLKFHAVVYSADGDITIESFETAEALAARLKALIDHDVSVFPFMGDRLYISKPPMRYLMTPSGNIPLFEVKKDNLEPDDTGYLGMDPIHFEDPPQIKVQPVKPASAADEFFDDNTDDTLGVFDSVLPDPDS